MALISKINPAELVLTDKLVYVNRVAKVVKGGKRLSFSALVVTGDGVGHVGVGLGKAKEVPVAISKAGACARKNLITVSLAGTTIPHEIELKMGAARILLKPAAPGTGIIAGGSMRVVQESSGVKDILTKSLGTSNKYNSRSPYFSFISSGAKMTYKAFNLFMTEPNAPSIGTYGL